VDIFSLVILSLWVMLPAYIPNNAAAIFGKGTPLDFNRSWRGNRIFGDGKTIRGTIFGILFGILTAIFLNILNQHFSSVLGIDFPIFPIVVAVGIPIGSLLGDAFASFIKRSLNIPRGHSMPLLDQLDFVIGSLSLAFIISPVWFFETFSMPIILTIFLLTPILHLCINAIGYLMGIKKVPW